MSIHQINKLFQNKGCNIAVSVVLLGSVAMWLGGGTGGCGKQTPADQKQESDAPAVAKIGDFTVTKDQVEAATDRQMEQLQGAQLPPDFRLRFEGQALNQAIDQGLTLIYAKAQGADLSDNTVKQRILSAASDAVKESLIGQGKLAEGATQQEFENVYKAQSGKSFVDAQKEIQTKIDELMKTPAGKAEVQADASPILLVDKFKSKYIPTEATIKEQYDTYQFKVIAFNDPKVKDSLKRAQEALKEIKGGLSFEAAMDKYSTPPPPKNKKASEQTTPLLKSSIESDPSEKSLLSLKPGQVSEVINTQNGPQIYKLISSGISLPKDFEKQKAALMDQKAKSDANKAITDEVKKLEVPANIKWESEGFHVLYDYSHLPMTPSPADRTKRATEIMNRALDAQGDPVGGQEAVGVAQMVLPEAVAGMTPAQAVDLRIKVLSAYSSAFPDQIDARLQVAEAYMDKGDAEQTEMSLHDAADVNSIHTDVTGKATWDKINKDVKTAESKKLLKPDQVKLLNDMYTKWQSDYAAAEAETKRQAEAQKKLDEELSKQGKANPPSGSPPNSPPTGAKKPPAQPGSSSILHPSGNGKH